MTTRTLQRWARVGQLAAVAAALTMGLAQAQPMPGGPGPGMGGPGMMGHGPGGPGMGPGGPGGPGMGPGMHRGAGMHHGPGMHGGMGWRGDGMRAERMLDLAGASPEQRAKVHQIMRTAHDDLQKQHEAGRAMRQDMAQLMAAPKLDAAAIEAARQRMSAHHDGVSKRMTQAMVEAGSVLTPEQREKVATAMKARRDMAERHRKEREALAPKR